MPRKGRRDINGWLVIDKPAGPTSAAIVGKLRKLTNAAKVGHGGTLDPLATGILPLAFGEATKTVSFAMDGRKSYRFTVRWGEARSTEDAEGEVTATSDHRPDGAAIRAVLSRFIGEIEQVPPAFSAIKVDGRRAYQLARADQPVALKPRRVTIERLDLVEIVDADHAVFEADVGKGTYIRSLGRDISQALSTVGHLAALRRTRVGPFAEKDAISLESAMDLGHSARLAEVMLPVATALDDIPVLALTEAEARRLGHGQAVPVLAAALRSPLTSLSQGAVVCAMTEGKPVALARISGGELRPVRVLNL
jgi:tRNA pseudouridine55 synthase